LFNISGLRRDMFEQVQAQIEANRQQDAS